MRPSLFLKRLLPFFLALDLTFGPLVVSASSNIPGFYGGVGNLVPPAANTLPQIQNLVDGVSGLEQVGNNRLIVRQDKDKAIIEWKSFDIGANAWTHFDQKGNTHWSALNRIYDQNPSQIFGQLTADGKVFLINQNGMLFSPGAKVDVHGMAASSLNIKNNDFLNDQLTFKAENYQGTDDYDASAAAVSNHGAITTDDNGSVMLIGPTVENSGTIEAPLGRIIMASGTDVAMEEDLVGATVEFMVNAEGDSQRAVNYETGRMEADRGHIGMFGRIVNQDGLIRAVTAIRKNGSIELRATERLNIGESSLTESPISTSDESVHESFDFTGGEIAFSSGDLIDFKGEAVAPSGSVTMHAANRVYLDAGSRIDVSGSWVELSAEAAVASAQLNSVEMKDDYQQKQELLQGETISFNVLEGSGIGDISGTLTAEEKTALERSIEGGEIQLLSDNGEVIARSGAELDFSGGGITYDDGFIETSILVSGNQVYRIEEAPNTIAYESVIGPDNPVASTNERFGISEPHDGTYHMGSGNAIRNFCSSYHEGADAGWLDVDAPVVILNASLDGTVTPGIYQTEDEESRDEYGYQTTLGTERPDAGTLLIGGAYGGGYWQDRDPIVENMAISQNKFLLSDQFDATSDLPESLDSVSILPTDILNNAGLENIILSVREGIIVESNAAVQMDPASSLTLAGRHIEHHGTIDIAGGRVNLILASNLTSFETHSAYIDSEDLGFERIFLAGDSRIDVSGQHVDLSQPAQLNGSLPDPGFISGGEVRLEDWTVAGEGIIVMPGAGIDVSGGWRIGENGQVTGGNGGKIQMAAPTLILEGDLSAHALCDADGGELLLHAQKVTVKADTPAATVLNADFDPEDPLPADANGHLVLSDSQIDITGAAHVDLRSLTDLVVENGVELLPSNLKLTGPETVTKDINGDLPNYLEDVETSDTTGRGDFMRVETDFLQNASISLSAGKTFGGDKIVPDELSDQNKFATAFIDPDAVVQVSPQGEIDISGPAVEIAGRVSAPAGTINLSGTSPLSDMALTIASGASISAAAYNPPADHLSTTGLPVGYEPLSAGVLSISADSDLIVEQGAVLDVSASAPVQHLRLGSDGSYHPETVAGNPGEIRLAFNSQFQLDGQLIGTPTLTDMPGGTLVLKNTDPSTSYTLQSKDMETFIQSGFDDITIASYGELKFGDSLEANLGRKLTLDAPVISTADQSIALTAPWIVLTNTFEPAETEPVRDVGELSLAGDWIDIEGDFILSGFDHVSLNARHDIRLADHYYDYLTLPDEWRGRLETQADLIINADRVYPTTQSVFSIATTADVTTLSVAADPSDLPVYSAGGSLSLEAANILHRGKWYAPMGQLQLTATGENGRTYLDSGSVLSVAGEAQVNYGGLDDDAIVWLALDKGSESQFPNTEVQLAPEAAVILSSDEIIMRDDALVNVSGGGEILAYKFLPGIEGSQDPLEKEGRYVILPGMAGGAPGQAVYLEGNDLIDEGVYSILPESYAFMPGAIIIQDLGSTAASQANASFSNEGYAVSAGHSAVADTAFVTSQTHYYSVRPASDVLSEGNFTIQQMTAGNAGNFSVQADTTILNGTLDASPLEGYTGGQLALSSKIITASMSGAQLPDGFFYRSPIPDDLAGKLIIDTAAVSAGGFNAVSIGDLTDTEKVVIEAGSTLQAASINVSATDSILVGADSLLSADGEQGGMLCLVSPEGQVSVAPSTTLHAAHDLQIETCQLDLGGDIVVDNSSLHLISDRIIVSSDGYGGASGQGLVIDGAMWNKIGGVDTINVTSRSDITFMGAFDMQAADTLILDADRIVLVDDAASSVTIAAPRILLQNTSLAEEIFADAGGTTPNGAGSLNVAADDVLIHFGLMADLDSTTGATNDLAINGAAAVNIHASQGLIASGEGTLWTDGDLRIEAAGIATVLSENLENDGGRSFATADVQFVSSSGRISTVSNGNPLKRPEAYGGQITLQGRSIDHAGLICNPSGVTRLVATGATSGDGIFLRDGSGLDVAGTERAAGGAVYLETGQGPIEIATNAFVDVSAGDQGTAGTLSIAAPQGEVRILGDVHGQGIGGDFSLDARTIEDLAAIADRLTAGGFGGNLDFRAHQGDISLGMTDTLSASSIKIVSDAGSVNIQGTLDASQTNQGGEIEIYAGNDIHLFSGSDLEASATETGGYGGHILLAAQNGRIQFDHGAHMDVAGGRGGGRGGTVHLRALRDGNGLGMGLQGGVSGAETIYAEGFAAYEGVDSIRKTGDSGGGNTIYMDTLMAEAADWMRNLDFQHQLTGISDDDLKVLPGIEIRSDAGLTIQETIDFSGYTNDLPLGFLTLRSTGNLAVDANIIDARTAVESLRQDTAKTSWGISLAAGADLGSSDPLAVDTLIENGAGKLSLGDGVLIYTENAPIRFASAGDTELGRSLKLDPMTLIQMEYNIGSFSGAVYGRVGGDLTVVNGGVQTATGDIRLLVGGNLTLRQGNEVGAIRTIGQAPDAGSNPSLTSRELLSSFWEYDHGGSIALDIGEDLSSVTLASDAWDASLAGFYYFPEYTGGGIKGVVTMAGGGLSIHAAGDITCSAGVFGPGNLDVVAGKDLNGRFLISDGKASLNTFENFGMLDNFEDQPIEAFDAQIDLVAQGSIELGTVLNPTIANKDIFTTSQWNLGYAEDSAVSLESVRGDVFLSGQTRFYSKNLKLSRILPATLEIDAANDIILGNHFHLAPSPIGNLALAAGGDIRSAPVDSGIQPRYFLNMSDQDPSLVYGVPSSDADYDPYGFISDTYGHADSILHADDTTVATFHAGGDIRDLMLFVPKAAQMTAGGDIADIYYHAQNIRSDDITYLYAAGDIRFSSGIGSDYQTGVEIGGPGSVIAVAGNEIDLGTTKGIQAVGNLYNQALSLEDMRLSIYSGMGFDTLGSAVIPLMDDLLNETVTLFEHIREKGQEYSQFLAEGDLESAQEILDAMNQDVIDPFFEGLTLGKGDINMVNSQIYTSGNSGDIYILAAGDINVGKSTFRASGDEGANSGIYTTSGGSINVFANSDVNVNESRMMTFMGGDITAWSQEGNINAGRGSKTAISVAAPTVSEDKETGEIEITFTPPPVGSGVRAMTFDPDGLEGPREQPEPGDIYLFAPKGEIDAGEAGIAGKNIILAATQVVNVQNIEVGGASIGVPDASASPASLGALAGSGAVSETSKVADAQAGLGSAKERFSKYVSDLAEDLVPSWLAVEVIGFGEAVEPSTSDESEKDTDRTESEKENDQ